MEGRRRFLTTSDHQEEQKMHMQLSLWASNYLFGDVLEEVAMHVPMADLLSASLVSREWHRAVRSSLLYRPCQRPWLILRNICNPRSSAFTIHALDPYSRSWISVTRKSVSSRPFEMVGPCFLRGSTEGDRLCALMFRKMAISKDPFGVRWEEEMKAPRKFRTDPVVAEVAGRWVVVVGGESSVEYEEEEGSVEVYDKQTSSWKSAGLMPAVFNGSTTAASLSAVAGSTRLYIMERKTGWLTWFDPASQQWGPVRGVTPDPVSACAITIGSSGDDEKLLVVGVARSNEGVVKVRVWEVDGGDLGAVDGGEREEEMQMPGEMAGRLFGFNQGGKGQRGDSVIEVCGTERGGYVCNTWGMGNGAVMFGLGKRRWEWEWVPVPERVGGNSGMGTGRILCGCSTVRLSDFCV